MKTCWMVMILAGCWMSAATQTQSNCKCNYELETVCLPAGHSVDIPCPNVTGGNIRFNLLKNHEVIYYHEDNVGNGTPAYSGNGVEFLNAKKENESISFRLKRVDARSLGVYRCEGTKLFPPPARCPVYAVGKLLLVEGHQCNVNRDREAQGVKESRDFSWIWIVVLVSVTLYGVIVTICASSFWIKLKKTDSQSDYINTKPRAPNRPRKSRGVQNPAPRFL